MSQWLANVSVLLLVLVAVGCSNTKNSLPVSLIETPTPPEVQVRLTHAGPVFQNSQGMTLYLLVDVKQGCSSDIEEPATTAHELRMVYYREQASEIPSCTDQWPIFKAPTHAKAVGEWAILERADGTRQWAYQGLPVHLSYVDNLPGDVNGQFSSIGRAAQRFKLAGPQLLLPSVVNVSMHSGVGLVAKSHSGQVLFTRNEDSGFIESSPDSAIANWEPLTAGAISNPVGNWSVVEADGVGLQWAYKNKLVYYYSLDIDRDVSSALFDLLHIQPIVLIPEPPPPEGVTVQQTLIGPVLSNASGRTLYEFSCHISRPAGTESFQDLFRCDSWNDDPLHREKFCPGVDNCAEMWEPFKAPASSHATGGLWSVAVIPDPEHYPLRWIPEHLAPASDGGMKVWTYAGSPVYMHKKDQVGGDINGDAVFVITGGGWRALMAR